MTDISYWLMKSEPDVYGIHDLKREQTTLWDGIRNYQARNFMRTMAIGDRVFFYHSNCKPPGIVGLMEVCELGVVDPTQFDSSSKYHDAASKQDSPRWDCVRLRYLGEFKTMLSLDALKETYNPEELTVVRRGNRLSILPVSSAIATDLLKRLGPLQ
ncbi:MAG: EVE domain-containing protein [Synechococcus sp. TMED187]|jgi:predicted RNA-binding protein with PUA-like domain|nr:MAG: EVE domain-containing protein [Synechococcus sp. TMED187]RZO13495.1 MAG: EVE domain-containing protein [Synechococcus sp. MED-G135]|tara:strand:- start:376 stop:846 length:471 start_codon:yes stop_codon:yes gene_type:complete